MAFCIVAIAWLYIHGYIYNTLKNRGLAQEHQALSFCLAVVSFGRSGRKADICLVIFS